MEDVSRDSISEVRSNNLSNIFSDNRNFLIIILSMLLLLSVLGVTFVNTIFDWLRWMINTVVGFFGSVLGNFFYASGDILNASTNTVADVAKTSIDLGSGAINDVGNLMKSGVTGEETKKIPVAPVVVITHTPKANLDEIIEQATTPPAREIPHEPSPTPAENPIQKPIQTTKSVWCLIGNRNGERSCMEINPGRESCQSGEIFATGQQCIRP